MPRTRHPAAQHEHRQKYFDQFPLIPALVARSVKKAEIATQPDAQNAMWTEYSRLEGAGTWNLKGVRPWKEVANEARASGGSIKAQVGRVFGVCVEKGSELPKSDKGRKYKGRFVFGGDFVKDEWFQDGVFNDLGSSPATLEASKILDAHGLIKNYTTEIADAIQAYIQAKLGAEVKDKDGKTIKVTTWVRLPREYWPYSFKGIEDPVAPLVFALYGHPVSGGLWGNPCEHQTAKCDVLPVPNWSSVFLQQKDRRPSNGVC